MSTVKTVIREEPHGLPITLGRSPVIATPPGFLPAESLVQQVVDAFF